MIKNAEMLQPGDWQEVAGRKWTVQAAEMMDGLMQVLWRCGDERKWDEYEPGKPLIVTTNSDPERPVRRVKNAEDVAVGDRLVDEPTWTACSVDRRGGRVVVEWSDGTLSREQEYEPLAGILVEVTSTPTAAPPYSQGS